MPPTSRSPLVPASLRRVALFILPFAVLACNSDIALSPKTPASVKIVSGDKQTTVAGTPPALPLIVRVTNSGGTPLGGVTVNWGIGVGGGTLGSATSLTDVNGIAQVIYTPGTKVDTAAKVIATVQLLTATFTLKLIAGPPTSVAPFSGDGAAAVVNSTLKLFAKVVDSNGNGIPGIVVTWTAFNGGTVSDLTGTSDAGGVVRTTLTVGATPGPYIVTAIAAGLTPATFTITGV